MTGTSAPRRVAILGSTGSIGVQALDVIAESHARAAGADGDDLPRLDAVALAAGSNVDLLLSQQQSCGAGVVMLDDPMAGRAAQQRIDSGAGGPHVVETVGALLDEAQPDLVLNAIVGFAGLSATVAALERGIDVALANKESLVAAGSVCLAIAARTGARIIPVDSEHSALAQCLAGSEPDEVSSLVLTASGGPFRGRTRDDLAGVTVQQALAHPTWSMGGKISIDSATLMNKGLELIEACVLFDLPESQVEVVVHPGSIVHSLVRHRDQSLIAHLGWPDMRVPIAWALHSPRRPPVAAARHLDLAELGRIEFEAPDLDTFRCLALAREAARAGGGAPCVMNAANEVAVEAFLEGELDFLRIDAVVEQALSGLAGAPEPTSAAEADELDARARRAAETALRAALR